MDLDEFYTGDGNGGLYDSGEEGLIPSSSPFGDYGNHPALNPELSAPSLGDNFAKFGDGWPSDDTNTTLFMNDDNCSDDLMFLLKLNKYINKSQIDIPIVYCLISLFGLIGNGLVMFVIIGSKEITKTVANIYILNLAIADTMFLMTLPLLSTQRVMLRWPFGVGVCKVAEAIKHLNMFASVFFLTAMSIDRYFAVVYVVASNKYRTNKNTFFICTMIWTMSVIMVTPLLIYTDVQGDICRLIFNSDMENMTHYDGDIYGDLEDYDSLCDFLPAMQGMEYGDNPPEYGSGDYAYGSNTEKLSMEMVGTCKHPDSKPFYVFIVLSFIISFVLPFCIILICYIMIIVRLAQSSEISRTRSKQADRTRRKVTRMVIALVVTFFACWLPFHLLNLLLIPGIHLEIGLCRILRDVTFCLGFSNSCLNPILYTFLGHNFQERLRKSIILSLRSFSFSNFTRYTTNNTMSRGETGALTKKDGSSDQPGLTLSPIHPLPPQSLSLLPEEEPCLPVDSNDNIANKV